MTVHIPPCDEWSLDTRRVGRRILAFDRVESTNTLALLHATDPSNDGLVLLTKEQTAGRGQYGRAWTAPADSSVLMSVLLFPPTALRRPALLTAWAAVCVCKAILQLTQLEPRIKWPNDVLVGDKKVCGILIEQRNTTRAEAPLATVVGIGLNVSQTPEFFDAAGLPFAASLVGLAGQGLDTRTVAETLLRQLDTEYERLRKDEMHALEAQWQRRLGLLGKHVIAELANTKEAGRLLDLTFDGLVLESEGEVISLAPEKVRHLDSL